MHKCLFKLHTGTLFLLHPSVGNLTRAAVLPGIALLHSLWCVVVVVKGRLTLDGEAIRWALAIEPEICDVSSQFRVAQSNPLHSEMD